MRGDDQQHQSERTDERAARHHDMTAEAVDPTADCRRHQAGHQQRASEKPPMANDV